MAEDRFDDNEPIVDGVDLQGDAPQVDDQNITIDGDDSLPDIDGDFEDDSVDQGDETVAPGDGEGDSDLGDETDDVYDPLLLEAAGMTEAEAKQQFGSPAELEQAVARADARYVQLGASNWQQQQQPAQQQSPQQYVQQPQQQQQPQQTYQPPMPVAPDGSEWDEDTQKLINAFVAQQQQELAKRDQWILQQSNALTALLQQQQQENLRRYTQDFDNFIVSLGDEWQSVFGKSSSFEMNINSLPMQNRLHLDNIAAQMANGRSMQGQPPLPHRELLRRALRVAFPEHQDRALQRKTVQDTTNKINSRRNMMTSKPTRKQGRVPTTGREKALAGVRQYYRDHNLDLGPEEEYITDGV